MSTIDDFDDIIDNLHRRVVFIFGHELNTSEEVEVTLHDIQSLRFDLKQLIEDGMFHHELSVTLV